MEGRLFIRGCAIWRDGAVQDARSVVIEGEKIAAVDAEGALKALPGDWVCEARGRLLTPGLLDANAGLTSTLERDRLKVATALRQGVTCLVMSGDQAIATHAAQLGARVLVRTADESPKDALASRGSGRIWDPGRAFDDATVFAAPSAWLSAQLSTPIGRIAVGSAADLVLWDVVPAARFSVAQLSVAFAAWVIVGGRVAVRDGQLVGADYVSLAAAAR